MRSRGRSTGLTGWCSMLEVASGAQASIGQQTQVCASEARLSY